MTAVVNTPSNTFAKTVADVRKGSLLDELSEQLRTLTMAVQKSGRPGALKLTLTLKPASVGDEKALFIADDIEVKMPKAVKGQTIMFATDEGDLVRTDPRQKELEFKTVAEEPPKELRRVATAS